ncbi:MAG: hypothetical protein LBT89_03540 [Planctomycetaceae bacterium]|jgi:hypothetical protein|nr:hypothetical protein [Planctomycetaceae bacterium]
MPKKSIKKTAKKSVKKTVKNAVKKVTKRVGAAGLGRPKGYPTKVVRLPIHLIDEVRAFVQKKLKQK